jgi:hypothetical protein
MKNSSTLSYNFSMLRFNTIKLNEALQVKDPYTLGVLVGVITGKELLLPSSIISLVSLIQFLIKEYEIELEDDDWYLFVIGLLKALECYGLDRDYNVEWLYLDERENPSEDSKIILESPLEYNKRKYLCVTLTKKDSSL